MFFIFIGENKILKGSPLAKIRSCVAFITDGAWILYGQYEFGASELWSRPIFPRYHYPPYPENPKFPDNQSGLSTNIEHQRLTDKIVYFMLFPLKSNAESRKSARG
jgi:hypothetical protein